MITEVKNLDYYQNNCEEDYLHTPISVLRYISELEKQLSICASSLQLNACFVKGDSVWYNREKCTVININKDTGLFDVQAEDGFIYTGNEADRLTPRSI